MEVAAIEPKNDNGRVAFKFAEVGRALGFSTRTIARLVDNGEIRAVKIGGSRRIPRAELDRLLAGNAREAG